MKTVASGALHCAKESEEGIQFEEEGQGFGLGYTVDVKHRCQVDIWEKTGDGSTEIIGVCRW